MPPERFVRIESLYHAALSRSAGERAAFLEDACSGDEALRREVESLLAQPTLESNVLNSPAAVRVEREPTEARASLVGRRLGPYDITAQLGAGGMDI
ncbi:MAG: hypothetical protein ABMA15_25470 [Vicinamibacterales bacterium]